MQKIKYSTFLSRLQNPSLLLLQIDSSAIVEMEIIESDESDYEVDFSGQPSDTAEAGMYRSICS